MSSPFDIAKQQSQTDSKLVIAFEKMAEIFRVLLWEKAKAHGLSPIQIQLLIHIAHHKETQTAPAQLAREFNLTKPTISDAIKSLLQKELVKQKTNPADARSKWLLLTQTGQHLVKDLEQYPAPLQAALGSISTAQKGTMLQQVLAVLSTLSDSGLISRSNMCFQCRFYEGNRDSEHHCTFLQKDLAPEALRIDCPEFEAH